MLVREKGYSFDRLGVLPQKALDDVHGAWQQYPDLRVAIICGKASGLVAIDVDDLAEWETFRAEYVGLLPATAMQATGREGGGFHLLYRRGEVDPELLRQGKWSDAYPHIELKSKGMIIAAPSPHAGSGRRYQWRPGSLPADIGRAPLEARSQSLRAGPGDKPVIDCGIGEGPVVIRALQEALNRGQIPGAYVTDGRVVILEQVTGSPDMIDAEGNRPLPVTVGQASPAAINSLLANHTFTFKSTRGGPLEMAPEAGHVTAALAPRSWPGLKTLNGIIGAPVLRPDGTLLLSPGYDAKTGLYLASRVDVPKVPARPSPEDVAWARDLVFRQVLGDFPWCGPADKANYIAMLVTHVLRRRLRGALVPFFAITAPAQSSGKTLLTDIPGVLYGQLKLIWNDDETELRKVLTTALADQSGVISFDNLREATVVRSAVLSKLLTDRTWIDRLLGGNALAKFANNRLWCATGNNLRIGGDMRTRTVLIAIDPAVPHPERRTGFAIPRLESWINQPDRQRHLLAAVLALVADWAAAGCPLADLEPMRQFSDWVRMTGGFLAHHDVSGFLANEGELAEMDDDDADWAQFLARWMAIYGGQPVTSARLEEDRISQPWEGTFPAGKAGEPLPAKAIGRRLSGQRGRYHGGYVLRGVRDEHTKIWWWHVEAAAVRKPDWAAGRADAAAEQRGDIHKTWSGQ